MASDESAVVDELRLLREQQWTMHRALVDRIGETNARIDETNVRLERGFTQVSARIDDTNVRLDEMTDRLDEMTGRIDEMGGQLDETNARLETLASETQKGFAEVVARSDRCHKAFETFVDLVIGERRYVHLELDGIKTRLDVLERKAG